MLSYRHAFHAGNPADVFKHSVLIALVRAMQNKDKGIRFIDTHAGAAVYALDSDYARKNCEYARGIEMLWQQQDLPPDLADYLAAVRRHNPDGALRSYPGSPRILRDLKRPQDELVICELHPTEQQALKQHFGEDRDVIVHAGNGYHALTNFLPPPSGRALILIDPPFELKSEVDDLTAALAEALKRCGHAVYALWYPLIDGRHTTLDELPDQLDLQGESWLDLRVHFGDEQRMGRMHGCGMAIINCPFRARQSLLALQQSLDSGIEPN